MDYLAFKTCLDSKGELWPRRYAQHCSHELCLYCLIMTWTQSIRHLWLWIPGQALPCGCPHLCSDLRQWDGSPSANLQLPLQSLLSLPEGGHLALSGCGSRKCCVDQALLALLLRLQRAQALRLLLLRLALQPLYIALTCAGIALSGTGCMPLGQVLSMLLNTDIQAKIYESRLWEGRRRRY